MKHRFLLTAVLGGLFSLTMTSCTYIYEIKINSLEQSVVKIEDSNNNLTPEELDAAIQECGQKLDKITVKNRKYTPEQQERINNLTVRIEELKGNK